MVYKAVTQQFAGDHDARYEEVGEPQGSGPINAICHDFRPAGERLEKPWRHKAVFVDGYDLRQVTAVQVGADGRAAIGSRVHVVLSSITKPSGPTALPSHEL